MLLKVSKSVILWQVKLSRKSRSPAGKGQPEREALERQGGEKGPSFQPSQLQWGHLGSHPECSGTCWFYLEKKEKPSPRSPMCVLSRFSRVWLCATLWTVASSSRLLCPQGSPGRNMEWVACPPPEGSSQPRDRICISYVSCTGRWVFTTSATCPTVHP